MKYKFAQGSLQLSFFIVLSIGIIVAAIYYSRVDEQLQERYASVANEMNEQIQTLIDEKKEAILLLALSVSNNPDIKQGLKVNDSSYLQLDQFTTILEKNTFLKNIWFQIINKNGDSFYRSWTKKRGDKISLARLDIASMLKKPEIKSAISTGKFDITFKAMVPIYDGEEFLGIFEVIAKFNSIATKLENKGISSVFLVDQSYKKQLTKAFTQRFIQNYYVANLNVKEKHLKILENNAIEKQTQMKNEFFIDHDKYFLITYFPLPDIKNKPMGHFFLFKPLQDISVIDIYESRNEFFIYVTFLSILLLVIIRYIASIHLTQKIKQINTQLEEKVSTKNSELIKQGLFLQSVMDGVSNSVVVIDKDYNVKMMNKMAQKMTDYSLSSKGPNKCYKISHHLEAPCSSKHHTCPHSEVFTTGKINKVIHEHYTKNGQTQFIEITATPLHNENGEVEAIVELGHDITDHLLIHEQLEQQKNRLDHQAHHDALTGLPNRVLFIDRVSQAIKLAKRDKSKIAVLFIDLDRFKEINDTLGHSVGDKVLIEIAERLENNIRQADTVARLGGDEFTIILSNIKHASSVMKIAQKLVETLADKIISGENELYVTASIGISLYPDDGDNTELLLRNADSAMYQAKNEGRNNYQFYTQEMTEQAFERALLEKNLRRAIEKDEFTLFYQPQYNGRNNEIIGMEALLRWQHPEMGLVSPAKFVPIAEESGMIAAIGWQVIIKVIKQLNEWTAKDYCQGRLSINLSVKQIQQADFIDKILASLKEYQYNPQHIQFEVTESYIMTDPERAISTLQQLKDLNFTISIDDFGTGYSSLSYLKRLPVDELKIDQSFVRDVPGDEEDEAIVRSVISLAKSLNLQVIAEGVETKEQQNFLLAEHCENLQGYLFHRPASAEQISKLLEKRKQDYSDQDEKK
ncbi:MAG: EAL domain-containing protein [Gammaproteobacteria bacterium]|nr:EAL domain-containing protein [Gammaproteobacteria bacterium]